MPNTVIINGQTIELPGDVYTLAQLLEWKNIPSRGTAVAINGKLIPASSHDVTELNPLDRLTIISAAYGG